MLFSVFTIFCFQYKINSSNENLKFRTSNETACSKNFYEKKSFLMQIIEEKFEIIETNLLYLLEVDPLNLVSDNIREELIRYTTTQNDISKKIIEDEEIENEDKKYIQKYFDKIHKVINKSVYLCVENIDAGDVSKKEIKNLIHNIREYVSNKSDKMLRKKISSCREFFERKGTIKFKK